MDEIEQQIQDANEAEPIILTLNNGTHIIGMSPGPNDYDVMIYDAQLIITQTEVSENEIGQPIRITRMSLFPFNPFTSDDGQIIRGGSIVSTSAPHEKILDAFLQKIAQAEVEQDEEQVTSDSFMVRNAPSSKLN